MIRYGVTAVSLLAYILPFHDHSVRCSCVFILVLLLYAMQCYAGKDQSVMKIEDIELDPNPPQRGEPVTVSVNTKLCKSYI